MNHPVISLGLLEEACVIRIRYQTISVSGLFESRECLLIGNNDLHLFNEMMQRNGGSYYLKQR